MQIKEISHYQIEDEKGNIIKKGLHDLHDAHEHAVNLLLQKPETKTITIKAEIKLTKKEKT
ncbi:MAG: hypothetical protein QXJ07_06335 [Candidatus Bathyarchaeia archaeon]